MLGRDRRGPLLHRRALDLDRRTARPADQVMVVGVGAAAVDRLAVLATEDVDEPVVGVQRQGAVDGREADAGALAASSSWTSCAERKSSTPVSASRTACRWGVGRGPPGCPVGLSARHSAYLAGDVDGVPVAVVDVVDVVAVLDREVAAARPVLVAVRLVGLLVQRQRLGSNGTRARRRRCSSIPTGEVATNPASATSTMVAPGGRLRNAETTTPTRDATSPTHHRGEHGGAEAAGELLRRRDRDDHQRADQQQPDRAHRDADRHRGEHGDQGVVEPHRDAAGAGEVLVVRDGEQLGHQREPDHDHDPGEDHRDDHVVGGDRRDRAEEVALEREGAVAGQLHEHQAAGDAAVEEQRQREVAGGLAGRRGSARSAARPITATTTAVYVGEVPVSRPRATPVTRDVADAVTHQREPALDQVGADPGRGEARDGGGDHGPDHERREQEVPHQRSPSQRCLHRRHRPGPRGRSWWWCVGGCPSTSWSGGPS